MYRTSAQNVSVYLHKPSKASDDYGAQEEYTTLPCNIKECSLVSDWHISTSLSASETHGSRLL